MELGLTQVELAQFLGLGLNTVSRWELGTAPPTRAMVLLLKLMRDVPEARTYLFKQKLKAETGRG
jgi:DNA-binding transcriptional regulator YiaG